MSIYLSHPLPFPQIFQKTQNIVFVHFFSRSMTLFNSRSKMSTKNIHEDSPPTKRRKTNHHEALKNGDFPDKRKMGLLPTLLSLGVYRPTTILAKTLERTDLDLCESRLLLTSKKVVPSPLFGLLTNTERASIGEKKGMNVRAFDRMGREYKMVFKFLQSNGAYRMIGEWSRFLRQNAGAMKVGDSIDIWAFPLQRKEGGTEIGMALLHYGTGEEEFSEEKYSIVTDDPDCTSTGTGTGVDQERSLSEKKESVDATTRDEWIVASALLELQEFCR